MRFRHFIGIVATVSHLAVGAGMVVRGAEAAEREGRRFYSAHFLVEALKTKKIAVDDVRRIGQVYFLRVDDAGTRAIVAIDGFTAEIVGLTVLSVAGGGAPVQSSARHFTSTSSSFGLVVTETTFESYTEITSEELSSTEEYSEVSISESEMVSYEAVDDAAASELDLTAAEEESEGAAEEAGATEDAEGTDAADDADAAGAEDGGGEEAGSGDDGGGDDGAVQEEDGGGDDGDAGGDDGGGDEGGGDEGGGDEG